MPDAVEKEKVKKLQKELVFVEEKLEQQHLLLLQQSKLASMGEMLQNIAHQWKQPLNQLSLQKEILVNHYYMNKLNDEKIEYFNTKTDELVQYMSQTIDDFRSFFQPDKEKNYFDVIKSIHVATRIVHSQLHRHAIELEILHEKEYLIAYGFENEFKQVIINLLNNAKDALVETETQNKKITLNITQNQDTVNITIEDNAGGILEDILHRIFEPYFTTKTDIDGTGLGLYIAKNIIENMDGTLNIKNDINGALFTITLPKEKNE